jgi:hypothetical protein
VFNRKRGPKDDPIIANAARRYVVKEEAIEPIFQERHSAELKTSNPELYAGALENFSRKVKRYIRRRPSLQRIQKRRKRLACKPTAKFPVNLAIPESAP